MSDSEADLRRAYAVFEQTGHFPGCDTVGCEATRCAVARYKRDYVRALQNRLEAAPKSWDGDA